MPEVVTTSCRCREPDDPHCLACALPAGAVNIDVFRDNYNIPCRVVFDLDGDRFVIVPEIEGWSEPAPLSR